MPAIPHALRSADTRILDSRQLHDAAKHAAQSIWTNAIHLLRRIPRSIVRRELDPLCTEHGVISACYRGLNAGPSPAAVVGIVLGSVLGFVLLLSLLWFLTNSASFIQTSTLEEEDVVVRRRSRSPRSRRSHRSEMRESGGRRDRVVREERIIRERPRVESSRVRESIVVEESSRPERRVDGDDIVEVIEEHSSISGGVPPPRRKSRRSSGYNR